MADLDQFIGNLKIYQRWKEFITGYHARLQGALVYGISSGGTAEIPVQASAGGGLHVELQASTESVGQVGGYTARPTANLAPTTSQAYAAGDLIGGKITLTNVFRSASLMSGVLESLTLADKSTMASAIDFVLFATDTTGTTFTNDAAFAVADGDLGKVIGTISLTTDKYSLLSDNCVGTVPLVGLPITATTGTGLFAAAVNRSTGPIYASTGDLILTLGVLQD